MAYSTELYQPDKKAAYDALSFRTVPIGSQGELKGSEGQIVQR